MTPAIAKLFFIIITLLFFGGAIAYLALALETGSKSDWCYVGYFLCAAGLQLTVMGMGK